MQMRVSHQTHRQGFSLVELLVVIALIGLILGFSTPALISNRNIDLSGASLQAAAMFEEARAHAQAMSEPVRVMIHNDPSEPESYRRQIIATRQVASSGSGTGSGSGSGNADWASFLNPVTLPTNVFFDASQINVTTNTTTFATGQGEAKSWLYYEILPSGTFSTEFRNFVIGVGTLYGEGDEPVITNEELLAGFRLLNTSRVMQYRTVADIKDNEL